MNMPKPCLAVCVFALAMCSARAQSPSDGNSAATALADEMLRCSVYFRITAACLVGVPDTRVPQTIKDLNDNASRIGQFAASVAAPSGLTVEAQQARSHVLRDEMMASLNNTCHNIAILLHQYHGFCQQLVDTADSRQAGLLQQKSGPAHGN